MTPRHVLIRHYGTTRQYGGQRTYRIGREDAQWLEPLGWRLIYRPSVRRWGGYVYMAPPDPAAPVPKHIPVTISTD